MRIFPKLTELQIKEIKSKAEQRFYRACVDQLSSEWLIFHSIPFIHKLSGTPRDGEADFVIFSPIQGFLVVEVKGGGVEFDPATGKWTSTNAQREINPIKDPFQQALVEKKAILRQITQNSQWPGLHISHLTCGHAVFLPDIDNVQPLEMPEAPPEIIGSRADLQNLESWINKVFAYWKGDQHNSQALGAGGLKIVEQMFCTLKKVRPLLSSQIRDEEDRRIELTYQQTQSLRVIGKRKRAIICGGAGTGKTLLAVDRASQLAKSGIKTLLLCYNRPLADHLKDVIGKNDNLFPMTFHQLCDWRIQQVLSKTGRDLKSEAEQAHPSRNLYDVQKPYALALSTECLPEERFDAIIVDEGQDFKGDDYWLPIEWLLRDGKESYLYIFYDFNQALYQQNASLPIKDEPFTLTVNCRNTKYIHEAAYHFYKGDQVDPPDNEGVPVETHTKETLPEQVDELHSLVSALISKERMEPKDIVILVAGYAKENYYKELRSLTLHKGIKYSIEAHRVPNTVLVDTVTRFKGLESNILILWGLDEFDPKQDKEDLYVAFSRAKSRLHLFGTQAACQRALETHF
ncbi:MAG: NERD domain-containing protein [Chloroflexi bacterium]|nr:NERD domain-containing protein [Chloroflexota bacterium]